MFNNVLSKIERLTMDKSQLVQEIVELERQVGRIIGQHAQIIWIDSGLTLVQLRSLFLIANKGSTNFRKLAEALGVTPSNVTGIVDRLVEQGLVSRTQNPEDRREMMLQATDKGKALVSNIKETGIKRMTQILSLLSLGELSSLVQGLSAFIRAADSYKGQIKDEHD
jgi:MarR family transcriptional regulator, organic hydroperoxide resistance regulator